MESKVKLYQDALVRIMQAGTTNARVRRLSDGEIIKVKLIELLEVPEGWKPVPKVEVIPEPPVAPEPVVQKPSLDPRTVRGRLRHLLLEPKNPIPKDTHGTVPINPIRPHAK